MSFKNDSGKWLTQSLFFETTHKSVGRPHAIYTLKDEDHTDKTGREYKSLKKLFLSCDDPTEYEFAERFLGGWGHWKTLQGSNEIAPHIEEWRDERDARLVSKGVSRLVKLAEEDGSFQAAKWLAEKGWEEKNTKGRPTKQQVNKAAKEAAANNKRHKKDLERIRGLS